jgi:hypothetical protein
MLDLNSKANSFTDVSQLLNSDNAADYDCQHYDQECEKFESLASCSSPIIRHGLKPLVKYYSSPSGHNLDADTKSTASQKITSETKTLGLLRPKQDSILECFSNSTHAFSIYNSLRSSPHTSEKLESAEETQDLKEVESKIFKYFAENHIEAIDLQDELRQQVLGRPRTQNTTLSLV